MTENGTLDGLEGQPNQLVPLGASPVAPSGVNAAGPSNSGEMFGFESVADIPLTVAIDVGTLQLTLGDLVDIQIGAIFELPKAIGEPFEISINGTPVGTGEVIVVESSSGIKILEVFEPSD